MPVRWWSLLLTLLLAACGSAPVRTGHQTTNRATYLVKPGDTLFSIASRFQMDYHTLARINELGKDYLIHPGQVLRLSAGNVPRSNASSSIHSQQDIPATTLKFSWPAQGGTYTATTRPNGGRGLLINGTLGQVIYAAQSGRVMYRGNGLLGYGQLLIIRHDERYLSAYGHLQNIEVQEGEVLRAGQKIATMGAGPNGEPMLYFEIRVDGTPVDPFLLLQQKQ